MSKRDKYLTEAMGLRWWEYNPSNTGASWKNLDFSTWDGFGKLLEWAQKQEWFSSFMSYSTTPDEDSGIDGPSVLRLINPDRFADAVYQYLRDSREVE